MNSRRPLVVAIDGTSGSGKSSTARGVATQLGLGYLDTGAQFRAMTWFMLENDLDVNDSSAVATRCGEPVIESGTDPRHPTITVDGVDVADAIRSTEVTDAVSPVSTVPEVRARLLQLQRSIIDEALLGHGIVVEGRDIGSVVWPQAEVKVYLTADAGARAGRRIAQHGHLGDASTAEEGLLQRDRIDSGRATAPLTMADDAVHIDTTDYTLEEVIDRVVALAEASS